MQYNINFPCMFKRGDIMEKEIGNKEKYILIYNQNFLTTFASCIKFQTIEELNAYVNKYYINKKSIIYLGEYIPLKYEIVVK